MFSFNGRTLLLVIVKDQFPHLVYMHKTTQIFENIGSIGCRSCKKIMVEKHPCCIIYCVLSDVFLDTWGWKIYKKIMEKNTPFFHNRLYAFRFMRMASSQIHFWLKNYPFHQNCFTSNNVVSQLSGALNQANYYGH